MTYFDRQVLRAITERAPRLTDADLAALLADAEVSPVGRRVLEAEAALRAEQRASAQA
jgi:hypothetical protein